MRLQPRIQKDMPLVKRLKPSRKAPEHLALVGSLPCVILWTRPAQAHHLLGLDLGHGASLKVHDRWTIPLNWQVHDEAHRSGNPSAWLADRGVDDRALAAALWAASGDAEAMERIVFRAHQGVRMP